MTFHFTSLASRAARPLAPTVRGVALTLGLLAWTTPVAAQLAVDRSELLIRPAVRGERVGLITVTNASDRAVQAQVKLEDWKRSAEGANQWFPVGTVQGSCGGRLSVFPLALSLAAGASQSIRLSLADSVATLPQECWSAVMVEAVQAPAERNSMSYLVRTAVKVYVEPAGTHTAGEITDMKVLRGGTDGEQLEVWFRNTGTRHYVATGSVEFRRADNSVAAKLALPEYYILPGAAQRVIVPMPKLGVGEYAAIAMVDFGGDDIAAMQMEHVVRTAVRGGN